MNCINRLAIYLFVSLMVGCASRSSWPTIEEPKQRFVQSGYSLIPTNETGWVLATRSPYQLALAMKGAEVDETFAIQATLIDLPASTSNEQFLEIVRQEQEKKTDLKRFSVQTHKVLYAELHGSPCARSHILTLDNAAIKRSDISSDMVLEIASITCRHPKNDTVGVSVVYSQRSYQTSKTLGFMGKAKAVLDSVKFEDF